MPSIAFLLQIIKLSATTSNAQVKKFRPFALKQFISIEKKFD